jgi:hypothetical protein
MEQLFKLESTLRQEQQERGQLLQEVRDLEERCKRKAFMPTNLLVVSTGNKFYIIVGHQENPIKFYFKVSKLQLLTTS